MGRPVVIGIAGGTGSGKTTVAEQLVKALPPGEVVLIQQDSYYKDRSPLPPALREKINYDHPDALETPLLVRHLEALRAGECVEKPVYDFVAHARKDETETVRPKPVIILEGILILVEEELRRLMDIKIFVDTDADIRFIRRLQRDLQERGRSLDSVIRQYIETVRPMHLEFVEPSKRYADIIVPEGGYNQVAVDMLVTKVKSILA